MKRELTYLLFFLILGSVFAQTEYSVFKGGESEYKCFRIPAVIKAPNGNLLAFAEGRKNDCDDFGNVDIVMKRSVDNGKTWSPLNIIASYGEFQAGNPSPVVDRFDRRFPKGRIFLFYNTGTNSESEIHNGKGLRESLFVTSTDNGKTWSAPVNITLQTHKPDCPAVNPAYNYKEDWRTIANAPGHAIQLCSGKYKGRIIVPANHSEGALQTGKIWDNYFAHLFYSDDHGCSFKLGESVKAVPSSNESTAAELKDGKVMLNFRIQNGKDKSRGAAVSGDGGASWDTAYVDKSLIDPVCEGSILSVKIKNKHALVFCNPHSREKRENLGLSFSFDDGRTWQKSIVIVKGPAAYSDIVHIAGNKIGILFERGNEGGIYFKTANIE